MSIVEDFRLVLPNMNSRDLSKSMEQLARTTGREGEQRNAASHTFATGLQVLQGR